MAEMRVTMFLIKVKLIAKMRRPTNTKEVEELIRQVIHEPATMERTIAQMLKRMER